MRIVVVDNDRAFTRSLEMLLQNQGHDVSTITDSTVAAAVLLTERPEVLLLDLVMPGLSGIELLAHLSQRNAMPDKVILISGHSDRFKQIRSEDSGISAMISKPVDLSNLLNLIEATDVHAVKSE